MSVLTQIGSPTRYGLRKVRRYWKNDIGTDREERTAVTKSLDDACKDIACAMQIDKDQAGVRLLKNSQIESNHQLWILLT